MKKLICAILASVLLVFALASCNETNFTSDVTGNAAADSPTAAPTQKPTESAHIAPKFEDIDLSTIDSLDGVGESASETDYVLLKIKDHGTILIRLFPDVAPATVANFKKLVSEKFYDGLIFHRVIKNFMIQGGDPTGTGYYGSGVNIKGEFTSNGFVNNLLHKKGVVSMARGNAPDSASSQFFICQKTYPSLDEKYASFGFVVYGIDVVDAIANLPTDRNDKPLTDVVIESIRFASVPQNSAE